MQLFDGFGNFVGDVDIPDEGGLLGCAIMFSVLVTFLPMILVYFFIMKMLGEDEQAWYTKLLVGLISFPIGFVILLFIINLLHSLMMG